MQETGLVVSLPMRDGNHKFALVVVESSQVVSLPMRDGNVSGTVREVREVQVVSLPMRDGNKTQDTDSRLAGALLAYL